MLQRHQKEIIYNRKQELGLIISITMQHGGTINPRHILVHDEVGVRFTVCSIKTIAEQLC